jgi:hypothetical protein
MNEPDSMGIRWEASGDRPGAEQLYLATADALYRITPNKMLFMFEGECAALGGSRVCLLLPYMFSSHIWLASHQLLMLDECCSVQTCQLGAAVAVLWLLLAVCFQVFLASNHACMKL